MRRREYIDSRPGNTTRAVVSPRGLWMGATKCASARGSRSVFLVSRAGGRSPELPDLRSREGGPCQAALALDQFLPAVAEKLARKHRGRAGHCQLCARARHR